MLCKRGIFSVAIIFVFLAMVGVVLLHMNRIEKQQQHYRQHTEMLDISYRAAIHTYQVATEIYLRDTIRQPKVLQLLSQAHGADTTTKARLRNALHAQLRDSYLMLWQHRLRQLHFHLPDGESFLRFHQPDRFGDKLFSARPSVKIANTELRDVVGFEAGRIIDGFRYVTPLIYRKRHIGSVETSIPFRSMQSAMAEYADNREYQFLVSTNLIQERLFPDFSQVYAPSPFSGAWLIENTARTSPDTARPLSAVAQGLAHKLAANRSIMARMDTNQAFSVGLIQGGTGYVVSFLPVREITSEKGGYLLCYAKEPMVVTFKKSFLLELTGFIGLLLFSLWLLLRWRCSVAELAEQSARRQLEDALLGQQERIEHEERARISRELHDGIGQALQAFKLRLKLLLSGLEPDRIEERHTINQLIEDLKNTSSELRSLVVSLRPLPLSGMRVDEAVRWLCGQLEKDAGIALTVQIEGTFERVDDTCSLTVFRICQEALQNIAKHAGARHVQVQLIRKDGRVNLTIIDDGHGGAAAGKGGGSGLNIMRERVELAQGSYSLASPPGQGTRLVVELPCR
jgi:signal transduction histidine kinase